MVLDSGPRGWTGEVSYSGNPLDFYTEAWASWKGSLGRAYVFTEVEDASNPEREPILVLAKLIDAENFYKYELFNPDYTNVGISCGCSSSKSEICVFAFSDDTLQPTRNKPRYDTEFVPKEACDRLG